ncbi:MAG TPA: hypothetical protein VK092_04445 [Deinococcales bacterium]|nr:hypothetical protein [Deinococcales bacterium]
MKNSRSFYGLSEVVLRAVLGCGTNLPEKMAEVNQFTAGKEHERQNIRPDIRMGMK